MTKGEWRLRNEKWRDVICPNCVSLYKYIFLSSFFFLSLKLLFICRAGWEFLRAGKRTKRIGKEGDFFFLSSGFWSEAGCTMSPLTPDTGALAENTGEAWLVVHPQHPVGSLARPSCFSILERENFLIETRKHKMRWQRQETTISVSYFLSRFLQTILSFNSIWIGENCSSRAVLSNLLVFADR